MYWLGVCFSACQFQNGCNEILRPLAIRLKSTEAAKTEETRRKLANVYSKGMKNFVKNQ